MILSLLAILLVLKYGWTLFTIGFFVATVAVSTDGLVWSLWSLSVCSAVCSWRGHRWTIACTAWPGCFRRKCHRCRIIEASPDPRGGQPPEWIEQARKMGVLSC